MSHVQTVAPALSITMVTTNNRDMLSDCLQSIFRAPPTVPFEVLVVDNATTDGSADLLRDRFPQAAVHRNEARLSLTKNYNINLRRSTGSYVVLLNDDTVVHPGAFDAMIDAAQQYPQAGVIGCRLLNADGSLQQACYHFPSPFLAIAQALQLGTLAPWSTFLSNFKHWSHDRVREVPWVSAACMLVRRPVLVQVGLVDEGFAIYGDETDWQLRIRKAGWTVVFTPKAVITHYGGTTTNKLGDRGLAVRHDSLERYFRKHHGARGVAVLRFAIVLEAGIKLTALSIGGARLRRRLDPSGCKVDIHRYRLKRYLHI